MARDAIVLTVIGGFLGAGKTTLLNRVLRDAGDRRLAVLVNDFGGINIDAELVESRDGDMVRLSNGCICCGVSGDFIGALALLRDGAEPPEHVLVEASGVADPGAIAVLGDMPGYRRDAVVVVADAETVRERAADEQTGAQVRSQLRAADLVVLNKTDLVAGDALSPMRAWLREITGPSTAIVDAAYGEVPLDAVLGAPARLAGKLHGEHDHAVHLHFESWSWSGPEPVSGEGLVAAIKALPEGIVRAKGLLHLQEDGANRYVLQVVGRRFSIESDRPWADETPASRLVVIGLPGSVRADELDATLARLTRARDAQTGR